MKPTIRDRDGKGSSSLKPLQNQEIDPLIRPMEAAHLMGLRSRVTYWRWRKDGKLPPAVVVEGKVLGHRLSAINEWLDEHTTQGEK